MRLSLEEKPLVPSLELQALRSHQGFGCVCVCVGRGGGKEGSQRISCSMMNTCKIQNLGLDIFS